MIYVDLAWLEFAAMPYVYPFALAESRLILDTLPWPSRWPYHLSGCEMWDQGPISRRLRMVPKRPGPCSTKSSGMTIRHGVCCGVSVISNSTPAATRPSQSLGLNCFTLKELL
jgi:hypothetical protein